MRRDALRRIVFASVIATACAVVLATSVFTGFDGVRTRVPNVPHDPGGGSVQVTADGYRVAELTPPYAVIVHIRNDAAAERPFSIAIDGAPVCDTRVGARRTTRVDCVALTAPAARHQLMVTGPPAEWRLEYAELATHHGRSSGPLTAFVLPRNAIPHERPGAASMVLIWLVIAIAFAMPSRLATATRVEKIVYRTLATITGTVFGLAFVSPFVSPYRIVLSLSTFAGWMGLVLLARVWVSAGSDGRVRAWRRLTAALAARRGWASAAAVGAVTGWVFFGFASDQVGRVHRGNVSGPLNISTRFFDGNPFARDRDDLRNAIAFVPGGNDGQFFYNMTFDPFLSLRDDPERYREFLDMPPYRYGRIGFSLLTKTLSGDQARLYPIVMVSLTVAAMALCGALLSAIARQHGKRPWLGFLVLLIPGYWFAVEWTLAEPIAAAFLLGGVACLAGKRWWAAGLLLGSSLLVRETGALVVLAVLAATWVKGERRAAALVTILAFAPVAIWRLYVGAVFMPLYGFEAFLHHPDNLDRPLAGIRQMWAAIEQGAYHPYASGMSRAGYAFPILLGLGVAAAVIAAVGAPGPIAIAGLVYATQAIFMNYHGIWHHIGNAHRLAADLFLSLALVTVMAPRPSRWVTASLAVLWVGAAVYVLFGTYNVEETRRALLPWLF